MTDSSPFQLLTEAFQAEYRVNLSLERSRTAASSSPSPTNAGSPPSA